MNSRLSIMLLVAIVLAGGAAWIANNWIQSRSQPQSTNSAIAITPIVVAATKIPFGTKLEATHLKTLQWPEENIPEDSFTDIQPVVGKITSRSFVANEILLNSQIKDHLGGSTLSALITEGMRAISVRVDDVAGVAGFILPGNKVDIIATKGKGRSTYTLLHNIKVLAIDQEASPDKNKPAVVRALTLEVTPEQSEELVKAMKSGTLQFTLRNPLDDEELYIEEVVATAPPPKKRKKAKRPAPRPSVLVIPWTSSSARKCKGKIC